MNVKCSRIDQYDVYVVRNIRVCVLLEAFIIKPYVLLDRLFVFVVGGITCFYVGVKPHLGEKSVSPNIIFSCVAKLEMKLV